MRINSTFTDYYDCGISYGVDAETYFERLTSTLTGDDLSKDESKILENLHHNNIQLADHNIEFEYENIKYKCIEFSFNYVYVCGHVYPLVIVYLKNREYEFMSNDYFIDKLLYFYDFDNLKGFFELLKDTYYNNDFISKYQYQPRLNRFRYFFEEIKTIELTNIFSLYNEPILMFGTFKYPNTSVVSNNKAGYFDFGLNINFSLKSIQFKLIKDPFVCFQDIYMYVRYLKYNEEIPDVLNDKGKAQSKGFNCMSFRKRGKEDNKCIK